MTTSRNPTALSRSESISEGSPRYPTNLRQRLQDNINALDGLAAYRRAQGLPALSVQWGAWGSAGMATEKDTLRRLESQGIMGISDEIGEIAFSSLLSQQQVASEVAKRSLSARTRASSSSVVSTLEVGRDGAGCAAVAMDRVKDKLHHPSP